MAHKVLNVLFVCEGNAARSVIAEALLNRFGDGRFRAFGASTRPDSEPHPVAVEMLKASGISVAGLRPKSLSEFTSRSAPKMDFVIQMGAVPAAALRGLPGNPTCAQWGITDPHLAEGDAIAQKSAFRRAFRELENRIRLFVLLRHDREIGRHFEAPRSAQNA